MDICNEQNLANAESTSYGSLETPTCTKPITAPNEQFQAMSEKTSYGVMRTTMISLPRNVKLVLATFAGALVMLAIVQASSWIGRIGLNGSKSSNLHDEPFVHHKIQVSRTETNLRAIKTKTEVAGIGPFNAASCSIAPYVILGQPTGDSINIRLLSDFPSTIIIEWGDGTGAVEKTPPLKLAPSQPSAILPLANLKMSTRYAYRVLFLNNDACQEFSATDNYYFHTQRLFNEEFTFAVTADTHFNDANIYDESVFSQTRANLVAGTQTAQGYDFLIDLGDTFMGLKLKIAPGTEHTLYENAFKQFSPVARSAPLFLVNGNHDGECGEFLPKTTSIQDLEASLPATFARLRNAYFLNPPNGGIYSSTPETIPSIGEITNFYAWMWGNSLFVALDPYWYTTTTINRSPWQYTLGKTQYDWLNSVLPSPATLKYIFIHHYTGGLFGTSMGFHGGGDESFATYFEWGGYDPLSGAYAFAENRPGWDNGPVHDVCVRNHVSVIFRGHDHLYHVGVKDGVVYNTVPRTSEAVHKTADLAERWAEKGYFDNVLAVSGHLEVNVGAPGAIVSLHAYSGNTVMHQYSVQASTGTSTVTKKTGK